MTFPSFRPPRFRPLLTLGVVAVPLTLTIPTVAADPDSIRADDLVAAIVAENPERDFYLAEIAAAEAGRTRTSRWADPELSIDYGRKRARTAGGQLAAEGNVWAIAVTQTFEWPGRLNLRKALADQDVELARLGLARFERALVAEARRLAFGLHAAQAQATAVRAVSDRIEALHMTLVDRDPAGINAELDLKVIEAAALDLRQRTTTAELAVQQALVELNRLRGQAIDSPLRVSTATPIIDPPPALATLLADALENNFEFAARRAELARQGLAVDLARHERIPAISLTPFAESESGGEDETVVGLGLSLPLPVSGRAASIESAALARQRQADVAVAVARRDLERDVWVAARTLAARQADLPADPTASITAFRDAAALADRHYRLGAVPVSTYVELQRSYLDALDVLYTTQTRVLEAALQLEELTGLSFVTTSTTMP